MFGSEQLQATLPSWRMRTQNVKIGVAEVQYFVS
jgi:hypothetical protein